MPICMTYIEIARLWTQLQENRALINLADLLVDFDVLFIGPIAGRVPSQEIEILEHLLV